MADGGRDSKVTIARMLVIKQTEMQIKGTK